MNNVDPASLARNLLFRFHKGITAREIRLVVPTIVVSLALFLALLLGPFFYWMRLQGSYSNAFFQTTGAVMTMLVALLLGAHAGAQEIEDGTSELTRLLPISPERTLAEKMAGSLLAFGVWMILAIAISFFIGRTFNLSPDESLAMVRSPSFLYEFIPIWLLHYCWALAVGVWFGRVLPAVLVGWIIPTAYAAFYYAAIFPFLRYANFAIVDINESNPQRQYVWGAYWVVGCAVALVVALLRLRSETRLDALSDLRTRLSRGRNRVGGNDLGWHEWHRRGWLLPCYILFAPMLGFQAPFLVRGADDGLIITDCIAYIATAIVLGATFISASEHDSSRCFIYALPMTRPHILWTKIKATLGLMLFPTGLLLFAFWIYGRREDSSPDGYPTGLTHFGPSPVLLSVVIICLAFVAFLIAATLNLHFRSILATVALSLVVELAIAIIILIPLVTNSGSQFNVLHDIHYFARWDAVYPPMIAQAFLTALALMAWLFFLFGKTAIQEWPTVPKSLTGLLFAVALIEVVATFALCGWRDLVYLLLGW